MVTDMQFPHLASATLSIQNKNSQSYDQKDTLNTWYEGRTVDS